MQHADRRSELRTRLWNDAPDKTRPEGRATTYESAVLDQYRLYVEMADRVSARRGLTNSFFLTLNTGIFTLVAALEKTHHTTTRSGGWRSPSPRSSASASPGPTWYAATDSSTAPNTRSSAPSRNDSPPPPSGAPNGRPSAREPTAPGTGPSPTSSNGYPSSSPSPTSRGSSPLLSWIEFGTADSVAPVDLTAPPTAGRGDRRIGPIDREPTVAEPAPTPCPRGIESNRERRSLIPHTGGTRYNGDPGDFREKRRSERLV